MTILHVVDLSRNHAAGAIACAAAMRRLPGDHTLITLGTPPDADALFPIAPRRLVAPLATPELAWRSLGRAIAPTPNDRRRPIGVITCWSPGALVALHLASPRPRVPIVAAFTEAPASYAHPIAQALLRRALARAALLAFSESTAAAWRAAGVADVRTAPPAAARPSELPTRDDARRALGLDPSERLVALLADPPSLGDARRFVNLLGILAVAGCRCTGLVPAGSDQLRRAARFIRSTGRSWSLIPTRAPLPLALAACDIALCDARLPPIHTASSSPNPATTRLVAGPVMISLAAALGVTVIAPRSPVSLELADAGCPITFSGGVSAQAVASAMLAALTRPPAAAKPWVAGDAGLDVLGSLWDELRNTPAPGFPLDPAAPIPSPLSPSPLSAAP